MLFGVFDTETTGLPLHRDADLRHQPKVIEFGGIITDGHEIISSSDFICNPEQPIEQIITDITGLTDDVLSTYDPFRCHLEQLADYFAKCDVIISHNLSFDKGMMVFDTMRVGKRLRDIEWDGQIELCTVEQTFHQYGRRMRLQELYALLVGPYVQKHRALDDVRLLHEVCQKIGLYESFTQ